MFIVVICSRPNKYNWTTESRETRIKQKCLKYKKNRKGKCLLYYMGLNANGKRLNKLYKLLLLFWSLKINK